MPSNQPPDEDKFTNVENFKYAFTDADTAERMTRPSSKISPRRHWWERFHWPRIVAVCAILAASISLFVLISVPIMWHWFNVVLAFWSD